jgi:hypothetical protein
MHLWSNYEAIQKPNEREKQLQIRTKPLGVLAGKYVVTVECQSK